MRRREFIGIVGGAAAAWPFAAPAQGSVRRIAALLSGGSDYRQAFTQELHNLGWDDGRNLQITFRSHGGDPDRLRTFATELVRFSPELILAATPIEVKALRRETATMPIVFAAGVDPVSQGIVDSFARPGGNTTGCSSFEFSMGGKWVQGLSEINPHIQHIAIPFNPETAPYIHSILRSVEAAATAIKTETTAVPVQNVAEIKHLLKSLSEKPGSAVIFPPDIFISAKIKEIIELVAEHKLIAVYAVPAFAASGGLMAYGPDLVDNYRRAARLVDRILKGAKPADLPVEQPTKFELVINLKTAKALGLDLPPMLLARADEVID